MKSRKEKGIHTSSLLAFYLLPLFPSSCIRTCECMRQADCLPVSMSMSSTHPDPPLTFPLPCSNVQHTPFGAPHEQPKGPPAACPATGHAGSHCTPSPSFSQILDTPPAEVMKQWLAESLRPLPLPSLPRCDATAASADDCHQPGHGTPLCVPVYGWYQDQQGEYSERAVEKQQEVDCEQDLSNGGNGWAQDASMLLAAGCEQVRSCCFSLNVCGGVNVGLGVDVCVCGACLGLVCWGLEL